MQHLRASILDQLACARAVSLACLAFCLWQAALRRPAIADEKHYSRGVLIRCEGPITPMLEAYLNRKLDIAQGEHADLVIIEIDSPGGLLQESLEIAERLRDLNWAHTVAYVPREALSGAAIAALGCDEIVMSPQAVLGDAGPIFQGEDALFRHAPEKIRSHLAQKIRGLAQAKGRSPALAEAMVDMNLVVYQVKNKRIGNLAFLSQHDIDSEDKPAEWERIKPVRESGNGHFLEVSGTRAVELQLAQATADSREELKTRFGLKTLDVIQPTGVDTAVYILNLPIITGLLFVIGLIALYVEVHSPGIALGGLIAGLCFALFFWSRFLGGTADWLDVLLFVAGVVFLAVEIFVLPGFGVAGLTGLLLLVASLILASQRFFLPSNAEQLQTFGNTLVVLVSSGVVFTVTAIALSRHLGSLPFLGRLTLAPPETAAMGDDPSGHAGAVLQVGETGVADTFLRPAGKGRFGELQVDVVTDGEFITKGSEVRIIEIRNHRVVVAAEPPPAQA
jgi:membrane-bound serine protease (ClpP class)